MRELTEYNVEALFFCRRKGEEAMDNKSKSRLTETVRGAG